MVSVPSAVSVQVRLSSFQRVTTLSATSPKLSLVSSEPPSRSTSVRAVQPSNTLPPILVTLFGMVILVKPVQLANAESPMLVTSFGIVTSPEQAVPSIKIPFTITSGFSFCLLVNQGVPENADPPMLVTLLGISMLAKLRQF